MKTLIAIPSKNRVETFKKNAFEWVPEVGYDWKVFVEPQDLVKYRFHFGTENIVPLEMNDQGLGYCKGQIKDYALKNGYTHIFKIDDDVKSFNRFRKNLSVAESVTHFKDFMKEIEEAFEKYPKIKAVSFPYSFQMFKETKWEPTKRVQTAYIVEAKSMYANPEVSVFEDFATGLSIYANHGVVMKYNLAGIRMGVKVGGGTGGHQSFDREKQAMEEVKELKKIYPPLAFRKVEKPWKIEPDLKSVKI